MDTNSTIEQNLSVALNVVDGLDMGLAQDIQNQLTPLYTSKYGAFFQQMIFDIPLANLLLAILVFLFILLLRKVFTRIVLSFLQRLAKRSKTFYDDRIISALKDPLRFAFIIMALHFFFLLIFKETSFIKTVLNTLVIYTVFWAMLAITEALRELFYDLTAKFNPDLSREMGNFILAILKIIIGGIGLAAILQTWGINVIILSELKTEWMLNDSTNGFRNHGRS